MNEAELIALDELARGSPAGRDTGRENTPGNLPVFGERALREFDGSLSPMRIFDLETLRYLAVNDAAVKFYGYSREEFLRLTVKDTRHPEENESLLATIAEQSDYLRHRPIRRQVRKSGEVAIVELVTQDVLFNGRRARLSLTIDITGRLHLHELLWRRQQEFETLAEHLPDLVARYDAGRRFTYVNEAVEKLIGKSRDHFIGRTQREIGQPDDIIALYDDSLGQIFGTGHPQKVEFSIVTGGAERHFEAIHVPERDADGHVATVICVARDITERKRAEQTLRRRVELSQLQELLARAASEALTPDEAMAVCLGLICKHGDWAIGRVAWYGAVRPKVIPSRSIWHNGDDGKYSRFKQVSEAAASLVKGPFIGRAIREEAPVWMEDLADSTAFRRRNEALQCGLHGAFAFPLVVRGEVVAVMEVFGRDRRPHDPLFMEAAQSISSQLARLVEREAAHEVDARMAAIVESSQDAILSRRLDGTILTWNPGAERLYGYTAAEIVGRNVSLIIAPEFREETDARAALIAQGTAVPPRESVGITKDGRRVHVSTSPAPIRDANGNVCGVSTIIRDFTEQKRVELALRETNAFLRSVIESSRDCIKVLDLDGRLQWISPGGSELMETDDASALLERSYLDFWQGADRESARNALAAARTGKTGAFEGYCPTAKGAPRWWDESVTPVLDGEGRPANLLVVSRDITRRRAIIEALRESEERFRQLAENIDQVFWINTLSLDNNVYVSPAYEKIWGRSCESLRRSPNGWIESVHPDDLPMVREAIAEAAAQGTRLDVEYRIVRPDGALRWIRDRSYPMKSGDGIPMICGIAQDITENKIAEQERLSQAIHQRDALVREVHHRIKNSLQGVAGLLRQKVRRQPRVGLDIEDAISQLQSVALVYGLQETRPDGLLSLAEITNAICVSMEKLVGGRITATFESSSRRPACVSGSEAVSVAVALNELVFNALKHQPKGKGRKRAAVRLVESARAAEIRIANRGRLPDAFDYQAGRGVGHGLGLVRTLMGAPGGSIEFRNGRGEIEVVLTLRPPLLAERGKATAKGSGHDIAG